MQDEQEHTVESNEDGEDILTGFVDGNINITCANESEDPGDSEQE